MTREEEKNHQSYVYIIKKCDTTEIPSWEDVELAFQAGMEYADENPIHYDGKAYLYVLHKGVGQGKKEMLDKACEWLSNIPIEDMQHKYDNFDTSEGWYKFIKDFLKAMEE